MKHISIGYRESNIKEVTKGVYHKVAIMSQSKADWGCKGGEVVLNKIAQVFNDKSQGEVKQKQRN